MQFPILPRVMVLDSAMGLLRGLCGGGDACDVARCYACGLRSRGPGVLKGFLRETELRRWAPWAGVTLLILAAVGLETSMESVCWDPEAVRASKIDEAASCFEFWLFRYQTLIGAVAALIAGVLAWRGAMRQVAKADTQIWFVSKQVAVDRIESINGKLGAIDPLYRTIFRYQVNIDRSSDLVILLGKKSEAICQIIDRGGQPEEFFRREVEPLNKEFDRVLQALEDLTAHMRSFEDNVIVPDNIRDVLRGLTSIAMERNMRIMSYVPRLKTFVSITSPGLDAVRIEYNRIASVTGDAPDKLDILTHEALVRTRAERERLINLRSLAEEVADV